MSREAFDVLLAREAQATQAENDAHIRYDALLEKYHALRVSGANEPAPKAEPAKPDVVTQAIIAKAKNSLLLRKHYAEYVREQRALGVSEADIAKAIVEGDSDETEGVA